MDPTTTNYVVQNVWGAQAENLCPKQVDPELKLPQNKIRVDFYDTMINVGFMGPEPLSGKMDKFWTRMAVTVVQQCEYT